MFTVQQWKLHFEYIYLKIDLQVNKQAEFELGHHFHR